ncbi:MULTISPECIES: alpha-N-arabinofuranosidase [Pseudoxanthomonas]|uniref:non-reducing end alpha-L-arabinofuranosidase n=1 Tax=Pseudoxanthomonas taiwanensis J19 TaxID=935569 RepID=A0A562D657_9GAMM|nr:MULTISPECIES: alpha-L-arabinofuranosidase C-terminal domain-containing protein [Pseudoxanthomonas]TWH05042.1 alpha-N-arabinofuranosidase [Pseudoxanthomonas taiwanensis J19]
MLKKTLITLTLAIALPAAGASAQDKVQASATLHADQPGDTVSRYLFGQFAEHLGYGIYGGIWVGEDSKIPNTRGYRNDVLAALKQLQVPVVRWPGGCFADEYYWRDGIGPREKRRVKINTHWGGVEEPNSFGTHEFMDFAELLGTDAYVSGNTGSGSPREMAEWVEYMTYEKGSSLAEERRANGRDKPWKVPFFGIGNELWGCGGNMTPEHAANLHRQYQTFVKVPAGQQVTKVAAGANSDDYNWTDVMMKIAGKHMDALSVHYYTVPGGWPPRASSFEFDEAGWIQTLESALKVDELLRRHIEVMDRYDPENKVALYLDEWGTWYAAYPGTNPGFLQQQNTLRDALVASIHFDVMSRYAHRVKMANIAQMVNVLQAMILTEDAKMVLTPTYHAFEMYKPWQDATYLPLELKAPQYRHGDTSIPGVHGSAVRAKDGHVYVALSNFDPNRTTTVSTRLSGVQATRVSGRVLTAGAITAHNTFEQPELVKPATFYGATVSGGTLQVELPAKSLVVLRLE